MTSRNRRERLADELLARLSGCPSAEALQAFHDETLSDAERGALETHLPACAACREALRFLADADGRRETAGDDVARLPGDASRRADELIEAMQGTGAARRDGAPGLLARAIASPWGWGAGLAAAAAIVVVSLVPLRRANDAPVDAQLREGAISEIASLVDDDRPLPRNAATLSWSAGPPGTRYDLIVLSGAMQVLARGPDLASAEFRIPPESLESVESGGRLLWYVEATFPDGTRSTSLTFVNRVE